MLSYEINGHVEPGQIAELRQAVGWNGMRASYEKSLKNSYCYIVCYDGEQLVGFLDVVSNGVTDAYLQDLIVAPSYQRKGIGSALVSMAVDKLKLDQIYAISVLFEERLLEFYRRFGFTIMMAGQLETRYED